MFSSFRARLTLACLLAFFIGAAGCANNASLSPDEMWQKGKEQSLKGEKIIASQQTKLDKARAQVREGEALIERGTAAVESGRRDYQSTATKLGNANKPDQVEFESDRLKTIASSWKQGVEDIKNGNKLIASGNDSIQKAQSKIMEGRKLMDEGSQLMIRSQSYSF